MRYMRTKPQQLHTKQQANGFAMLFTVLVMTLILSIALGISNITYKQTILSSLARDSEIALYQADAGVECALYFDLKQHAFVSGSAVPSFTCGTATLTGGETSAGSGLFVYSSPAASTACIAGITIDKTFSAESNVIITSRGNNICQTNPRQVERALQVRYTP